MLMKCCQGSLCTAAKATCAVSMSIAYSSDVQAELCHESIISQNEALNWEIVITLQGILMSDDFTAPQPF